ncbi:hemocytin-like isoform X2 [Tachypleus tridentatus]|uniref:hemocytin-like isoform X2 n=1 Tax=Tachypleus tridentatus TaxID=6853 RepID=UPI003FD09856
MSWLLKITFLFLFLTLVPDVVQGRFKGKAKGYFRRPGGPGKPSWNNPFREVEDKPRSPLRGSKYGHPKTPNMFAGMQCSPLSSPMAASISCSGDLDKVTCEAKCMQGFYFPDGATQKVHECDQQTGKWSPRKTFPDCERTGRGNKLGLCEHSPSPMMGSITCEEDFFRMTCEANCKDGYTFPDGSLRMTLSCNQRTGQWLPEHNFPDCEPQCDPPCQNGGRCVASNRCLCLPEYRGQLCQYPISNCDIHSIKFVGSLRCNHTSEETVCEAECPTGMKFNDPNPHFYRCNPEGVWFPSDAPICIDELEQQVQQETRETNNDYFGILNGLDTNLYEREDSIQALLNQLGNLGNNQQESQLPQHEVYSLNNENQPNYVIPGQEHVEQPIQLFNVESGQGNQDTGNFWNPFDHQTPQQETEDSSHKQQQLEEVILVSSGTCAAWGDVHFRTFDGRLYDFPGSCSYILAADCVDSTFSIILYHDPGCSEDVHNCRRSVGLDIGEKKYVVAPTTAGFVVTRNGEQLSVPSTSDGLIFQKVAQYVLIRGSLGFTLWLDDQNIVLIEITKSLFQKTCGLCGRYDDIINNDFEMTDGTVARDPVTFGNSWKVPLDTEGQECNDPVAERKSCRYNTVTNREQSERATEKCFSIFDKRFDSCHKLIDSQLYYEACQEDCCSQSNSQNCECSSMAEYFRECFRLGGVLNEAWRTRDSCPVTCENGKEYQQCGSACERTCQNPEPPCSQDWCVDGCHCPSGKVLNKGRCISQEECPCDHQGREYASGEKMQQDCNTCLCQGGQWICTKDICPALCSVTGSFHYSTFDGKRYDFKGTCSYYLVYNDNFTIQEDNLACTGDMAARNLRREKGNSFFSCMKSVNIRSPEGTVVKLKQNLEVIVNGEDITFLPLTAPGIFVTRISAQYLQAKLSNGLSVYWDGKRRIYIEAPPALYGQTEGFCGTFNRNQADDFLTREGDKETNPVDFGNKWKVKEDCPDSFHGDETMSPCDGNQQRQAIGEALCEQMVEDIFKSCHQHVAVAPYYEMCLYDVCACEEELESCACSAIAHYAEACSRQKILVNWRPHMPECGFHCTGGQIYQVCGRSCEYTCSQIAIQTECSDRCVEGCACPQGMSLDANGICMSLSSCPCVHNGREYTPGFQQLRGGRMCECVGGRWDCRPATPNELLLTPAPQVEQSLCSAADHKHFTDCLTDCPVTCANMHNPPQCSMAVCKPGCSCDDGYVLDSKTGLCLRAEQCPCHHGGRSYGNGDIVKVDCNTCICEAGTWRCEDNECHGVCTSWGDSHYRTFDDKIYDFHGDCDYVLTKARIDGSESFSVVVQNVPCGTLGATCSKGIVFAVGEESVMLSHDRPVPVLPPVSKFELREIGLFIYVKSDVGISVLWDKGTRVYVRADPVWKGKLKGLCGDFNGDASDDFKLPSGGVPVSNPIEFGDSWKVFEYCPKSKQPEDSCIRRPQRKNWALKKCGILKSPVFQTCHIKVPLEPYYRRCVFDTCACDTGGDCECMCTSIAAYAHECTSQGVMVLWRSQELCPIQCDESCDHYSGCVSVCPKKTCDNRDEFKNLSRNCASEPCVEGCAPKPCPPGQILKSNLEHVCIPEAKCEKRPCSVGGHVYKDGQRIEDPSVGDKCQSCYCRDGKTECKGKPCLPTRTLPPTTSTITPEIETMMIQVPQCDFTGWTPWMNSVMPTYKNGGDYEELTSTSRLRTVYRDFCPVVNMTAIQCRIAGTLQSHQEGGQKVSCSLPSGLICLNKNQDGAQLCLDYEIRVYCDCGHLMSTILPSSSTTVSIITPKELKTTSTLAPPVPETTTSSPAPVVPQVTTTLAPPVPETTISTLAPPVTETTISTLAPPVPETTISTLAPPVPETTISTLAPSVPETTISTLTPSVPETTISTLAPPVPKTTISTVAPPVPETTISTLAPPVPETTISTLAPPVPETTISTLAPPVPETTTSTAAPPVPEITKETTVSTPFLCSPDQHGWTDWMNSDDPTVNPDGDMETYKSLREQFDFCYPPFLTSVECRVAGETTSFNQAGQNGITCDINRGLQCLHSLQAPGHSCKDYEVRFFCNCLNVTTTTLAPETSTTPTISSTTLLPFEKLCDEWSIWINSDSPSDDGKDIELLSDIANFSAICPIPLAVECRDSETGLSHRLTKQNLAEPCTRTGIICENSDKQICNDYEIRVYCTCPSPRVPKPSTPFPVTPTSPCPPGVEWDFCAFRCDQICISFLKELQVRGECKAVRSNEQDDCVAGCKHVFCQPPYLWRDEYTCVLPQECTCVLDDGTVVSPGAVVEHECEKCQCLNNSLVCYTMHDCGKKVLSTAPPLLIETKSTPVPKSPSPIIQDDCWTSWINLDDPKSGGGDFEDMATIRAHYNFCPDPAFIECRAVISKEDAQVIGQTVECDKKKGLHCWNNINGINGCSDYEVRFFCPCEASTTPLPPGVTTVSSTAKTTPIPSVCQPGWTPWLNGHTPDSSGDYENMQTLRDQGYIFCSGEEVTAVECQQIKASTTTQKTTKTDRDVVCDVQHGLVCKNENQVKGKKCADYEIRFLCDCLEGSTEGKIALTNTTTSVVSFIPFSSTLPPALVNTTAAPVKKLTPAATSTVQPPCAYWSDWINSDSPLKSGYLGDKETTLPEMLIAQGFCSEGEVSSIQCHDADFDQDFTETGELGLECNLNKGFVCTNTEQPDGICKDYKIRYFCSCVGSTVKPQTTAKILSSTPSVFPSCNEYIDLVGGSLPDSSLRASSSLTPETGPQAAVMVDTTEPRAWTASELNTDQFIEVNLGYPQDIYGVVTQGKMGSEEWVTSYTVLYSRNDGEVFKDIENSDGTPKVFSGNYDNSHKVEQMFPNPIKAKTLRIQPKTWKGQISLRFGVLGCSEELTTVTPVKPKEVCMDPMGLEDGMLADSQITASSSHDAKHKPENVRLGDDSWMAAVSDDKQYLQVDFMEPRNVTAVITQGRDGVPQWVTSFMTQYSNDGKTWNTIADVNGEDKVFSGNFDSNTKVTNYFPSTIRTRYLRILPVNWKNWISMQLEVLGCFHPYPTTTITTPTPTTRVTERVKEFTMSTTITIVSECSDPMGLENGMLSDDMISVSSAVANSGPSRVRLDAVADNGKMGGWVPETSDENQYLQIDFRTPRTITGVITQGRDDADEWVTSFMMLVSNDTEAWIPLYGKDGEEKIPGNSDRNTPVIHHFQVPASARYVRIVPLTWHERIGLRMELVGCYHPYETYASIPPLIDTGTPPVPTTTTEACVEYGPWVSLSVPKPSELGDIEPISDIIAATGMCSNPVGIECREYSTGRNYRNTGQKVSCDLTWGLKCLHEEQKDGLCLNYEARIKCWSCGTVSTYATTTAQPVLLCPELTEAMAKKCPLNCQEGLVCNGTTCIDPVDCVCVHKDKIYSQSDIIETSDCQECLCVIGGRSSCAPKVCQPCQPGQKSSLLSNCSCICEGCPENTILCPTSGECIPEYRWCDGVIDCPDDEKNCLIPPTTTTTTCPPPVMVTCLEGYTVSITKPSGSSCVEYDCVPISTTEATTATLWVTPTPVPQENATCELINNHLRTLDGQELVYDICDHLVLQDILNNEFNITIHKDCELGNPKDCKKRLEIHQDKDVVKLDSDLNVELNGHYYTASQLTKLNRQSTNYTLQVIGDLVIFQSLVNGFSVTWDKRMNLKVGASKGMMYRVAGLCGLFNGEKEDDKQMPDGKVANTGNEFGDSWSSGMKDRCAPQTCPVDVMTEALETCNLLTEEPFDECQKVVSVDKHVQVCVSSLCECLQKSNTSTEDCRCDAFLPLVQACETKLAHPLQGWRLKHGCVPSCPPGMEWHDCGPSCDLSCENQIYDQEVCNKECVPGCFCPPGTVRDGEICKALDQCTDQICQGFGDPHFQTFDGWFFPFQSTGFFTLATDKTKTFVIEGTTEMCSVDSDVTCITALSVTYKKHTVIVRKGEKVRLDGQPFSWDELPKNAGGMTVLGFPGQTTIVIIPDLSIQVRYFEMNGGFSIMVPSRKFFDKVDGLCGNCNFKRDDDMKTKNGTVVSDTGEFVCSWLREGNLQECKTSFEKLPNVTVPPAVCNELWNEEFKSCHPLVAPELYNQACRYDISHGGDMKTSVCKALMEYARQCCQAGETVKDWIEKYGCNVTCPEGMEYFQCHDACPETCDNTTMEMDCHEIKVDGCFCPEGKALRGDQCIPAAQCETCDEEGHVPGDTWTEGACQRCHCSSSYRVDCLQELCASPPVCYKDETLITIPAENGTCCPRFICEPIQPTACPAPVVPECLPGQVAKLSRTKEASGVCNSYECECDSALCPPVRWPDSLEVGQHSELVRSDCCSKVVITCRPETCPVAPTCAPGLELKEIEGECCPIYRCKPPEDLCIYSKKHDVIGGEEVVIAPEDQTISTYKPGEEWKDGLCRNCTCEGTPGQYAPQCVFEQCPSLESLPDDKDYVLTSVNVPGQCCPTVVRLFCKDGDGNVHGVDSEWQDKNDPCKSYSCELTSTGEMSKVSKSKTCQACPKTSEYIPPTASLKQCCGICRPVACEEGNNLHKVGEKWNSTVFQCYSAECVREGEGVRTLYRSPRCSAVPENCPQDQVVWDDSGCCQKCNMTPSMCTPAAIPIEDTIEFFGDFDPIHGFCLNKKPVFGLLECSGKCNSHSYFSMDKKYFHNKCQCCQAVSWEPREVDLECKDGNTVKRKFQQPTDCECTPCTASKEDYNSWSFGENQINQQSQNNWGQSQQEQLPWGQSRQGQQEQLPWGQSRQGQQEQLPWGQSRQGQQEQLPWEQTQQGQQQQLAGLELGKEEEQLNQEAQQQQTSQVEQSEVLEPWQKPKNPKFSLPQFLGRKGGESRGVKRGNRVFGPNLP